MFNSFIKYPWSLASELNLSQVWWQRNQDVDRKNTGFKEKTRQNLPVWLGRTRAHDQSPGPTVLWPLPVTYHQSEQTTGVGTLPTGLNLSQALFNSLSQILSIGSEAQAFWSSGWQVFLRVPPPPTAGVTSFRTLQKAWHWNPVQPAPLQVSVCPVLCAVCGAVLAVEVAWLRAASVTPDGFSRLPTISTFGSCPHLCLVHPSIDWSCECVFTCVHLFVVSLVYPWVLSRVSKFFLFLKKSFMTNPSPTSQGPSPHCWPCQ